MEITNDAVNKKSLGGICFHLCMWHFHVVRPVGLWSWLFLFVRVRSVHCTGFPSLTWVQNVISWMNNFRARLTGYTMCWDDKIGDILCNFSPTYHFSFSVYNLQQRVVKGREYQLIREQALHERSHEKAREKGPDISRKWPATPYQSWITENFLQCPFL